ncbi:hypothetical protein PHJA_002489000, partial [Phtheirospermum japonicum]
PSTGPSSSPSSSATSSSSSPSRSSPPPSSSSPSPRSTPPSPSRSPPPSPPSSASSSASLSPSYGSLLMVDYNIVFLGFLVLLIIIVDLQSIFLFIFSAIVSFILFLGVHVYISALWHLASVVSILEPLYGFAAMKKSYELLSGNTRTGFFIVFVYMVACGMINGFFGSVMVHGGDDYGVVMRIVVCGFLVGVLVVVNLVGLFVQSVF